MRANRLLAALGTTETRELAREKRLIRKRGKFDPWDFAQAALDFRARA